MTLKFVSFQTNRISFKKIILNNIRPSWNTVYCVVDDNDDQSFKMEMEINNKSNVITEIMGHHGLIKRLNSIPARSFIFLKEDLPIFEKCVSNDAGAYPIKRWNPKIENNFQWINY